MNKPKRIQRKRTKGWRMPENAVYVGRPTKWGNPFTGPDAVERYKALIEKALASETGVVAYENNGYMNMFWLSLYELEKLRGKDLACWCPLDKPCHADILLELIVNTN